VTLPPLLFALLMWFIGTATIVWLDSRPRETFRASLSWAGVVAVVAMALVWAHAASTSEGGAYTGFAAAIVIWGWHEMSFLMGEVAGPNREPCPPGAVGWARFKAATATVIHHELAIAATAVVLVAMTWGQPNQAAPLAFLLLFALRLSAKFNLYLGVPNLSDEVFPEHLAYLKSYFRTRAMNPLFPVSIAFGTGLAVWAWQASEAAPVGSGAAVCGTLLAGLAVLGVVEHLFLVLPVRDAKLFRWASGKGENDNRAAEAAATD
jgi:putative photosynthetic complex assembly protein 2